MLNTLKLSLQAASSSLSEKLTPLKLPISSRRMEADLMHSYLKVVRHLEMEFNEVPTADLITEMTNILNQSVDLASSLNLHVDLNTKLEQSLSVDNNNKVSSFDTPPRSQRLTLAQIPTPPLIDSSSNKKIESKKASHSNKGNKEEKENNKEKSRELSQVEKEYIQIVQTVQLFLQRKQVQCVIDPSIKYSDLKEESVSTSMPILSNDDNQIISVVPVHEGVMSEESPEMITCHTPIPIDDSVSQVQCEVKTEIEREQEREEEEVEELPVRTSRKNSLDDPEFEGYKEEFEPNSLDEHLLNLNTHVYSLNEITVEEEEEEEEEEDTITSTSGSSPPPNGESSSTNQSRSSRRAAIQAHHQAATKRLEETLVEIRENLRPSSISSRNNIDTDDDNMTTEEEILTTSSSVHERILRIEKNTSSPVFPKDYKTPTNSPPITPRGGKLASESPSAVLSESVVVVGGSTENPPASGVPKVTIRPSPLMNTLHNKLVLDK